MLTDATGISDAIASRCGSSCGWTGFESLMNAIEAKVLFVGAGAAALSFLLIMVNMEGVVLDKANAE